MWPRQKLLPLRFKSRAPSTRPSAQNTRRCAFLLLYLLLAIFIYRGKSWARTWALVASTVSTAMWIVAWLVGSAERTLALNLWGAAAEITVLLALSSDAAREFVTARLRRPLRTRGEVSDD